MIDSEEVLLTKNMRFESIKHNNFKSIVIEIKKLYDSKSSNKENL